MQIDIVSIVIPVFNTKEKLEACINSVLKQKYSNFEVILVDDGSNDGSELLCDYLANNDNRIRVIHQKNSGVSQARNCGIEVATGKYITFVDSDDTIKEDYLKHFIEEMSLHSADFIFSGYEIVNLIKKNKRKSLVPYPSYCSISEFLRCFSNYEKYLNSSCTALYKMDIIRKNKVSFPVGVNLGEDKIFVTNYLLHCKSVSIIASADYEYYIYQAQTLTSFHSLDVPVYNFQVAELRTELFERNGIDIYINEYGKQFYNTLTFNFIRIFSKKLKYKNLEKICYCSNICKDLHTRELIKKYKAYNINTKILNISVKLSLKWVLFFYWTCRRIIS